MAKKEALIKALTNKLRTETVSVIHARYEGKPTTVALVNVDKTLSVEGKLEKAFMLTNSVNDAWYTNEELIYMGPEKSCRSTMAGDYVKFENGKKFKCEHSGWSEV